MKHLLALMALCVAFAAGAQTGLVEFPYNPDADNDDIIGVNDLLELLSLFGSEFAEESLYLNDSETAAIYHVNGSWNFGMCMAKCSELPSGKWRMIDMGDWAQFHEEIESIDDTESDVWIGSGVSEFGYSSSNLGGVIINRSGTSKGAIEARSLPDSKMCICSTHERPKVEYTMVVGQFEANDPQWDMENLTNEKTIDGWYPLGSMGVDGSWFSQAFWRWAE